MTARTRLLRVVAACILSGLIAGVLTASQCGRAGLNCNIAALEAFSPDPVPWTLWLHWINWLPGVVFGLFFALAAVQWGPFYGRRALLYALASGVIYVAAALVFSVFLDFAGADEFALIVWLWPAGMCAGLVGGLLLAADGQPAAPPLRQLSADSFAGHRCPPRPERCSACCSC